MEKQEPQKTEENPEAGELFDEIFNEIHKNRTLKKDEFKGKQKFTKIWKNRTHKINKVRIGGYF